MKKKILISTLGITIFAGAILRLMGKNPLPLISAGIILIIILYALIDMPPKHRTFSYRDQLKGMLQSWGGNPPPEAPKPDEEDRDKVARESA